MERSKIFAESGEFYCYSLADIDERDEADIKAFEPVDERGRGLVLYLQRCALPDEEASVMRTYLVRDVDTDELVGYFSLKAGLVSTDEVLTTDGAGFDTLPGIELANFAINGRYRRVHPATKGCEYMVYDELVSEVIAAAAKIVGVAVIYIFSLPDERVVANYGCYGFRRLSPEAESALHRRLKPRYDEGCVFMYTLL